MSKQTITCDQVLSRTAKLLQRHTRSEFQVCEEGVPVKIVTESDDFNAVVVRITGYGPIVEIPFGKILAETDDPLPPVEAETKLVRITSSADYKPGMRMLYQPKGNPNYYTHIVGIASSVPDPDPAVHKVYQISDPNDPAPQVPVSAQAPEPRRARLVQVTPATRIDSMCQYLIRPRGTSIWFRLVEGIQSIDLQKKEAYEVVPPEADTDAKVSQASDQKGDECLAKLIPVSAGSVGSAEKRYLFQVKRDLSHSIESTISLANGNQLSFDFNKFDYWEIVLPKPEALPAVKVLTDKDPIVAGQPYKVRFFKDTIFYTAVGLTDGRLAYGGKAFGRSDIVHIEPVSL